MVRDVLVGHHLIYRRNEGSEEDAEEYHEAQLVESSRAESFGHVYVILGCL